MAALSDLSVPAAAMEVDTAMRQLLLVVGRGRHTGRVHAVARALRQAMTRAVIAAAEAGVSGTPEEARAALARQMAAARATGALPWGDFVEIYNATAEGVPHG